MKIKRKKNITICVSLLMLHIYYREFIVQFDPKRIHKNTGLLQSNPEYHKGSGRSTSRWYFKLNGEVYELSRLNPVGLSKKDIHKLKKGDQLVIYSYPDYSFSNFIDFLNGRIRIVGMKSNYWDKFNLTRIKNDIYRMDNSLFWMSNSLLLFCIIVDYFDKRKKSTMNSDSINMLN